MKPTALRLFALLVTVTLLAGCPLRPRYAEFIAADTTEPVKLQVVERRTGSPVAGARVEVGEAKGKLSLTTDAEGCFVLPVDKRLLEDNALLVVSTPAGVGRTAVVTPGSANQPAPAPAEGESAAAEFDAGT